MPDPTIEAPSGSPRNPHPATPEGATPPAEQSPPPPPANPPGTEDFGDDLEKWQHYAREHEKKWRRVDPQRVAQLEADAAELQKIRDAAKTQAEKDAEARAAAEQRATQAETDLARLRVATSKGLPAELAARLVGSTEDEMAEDADRLLAVMKPTTPPAPAGGADQGPQGQPVKPADLDEQIRAAQAAGDHRLLIELNGRKLAAIHAASPT